MSWPIAHLSATGAAELAIAAWQWWLGELAALVPEGIKRFVKRRSGTILVDLQGDMVLVQRLGPEQGGQPVRFSAVEMTDAGIGSGRLAQLRDWGSRASRIEYRIGSGQALRKSITLPLSAKRNLRAILTNEIDRQTPLGAGAVIFDYRVVGRPSDSNELTVELAIAKRELIERVLDLAKRVQLEPTLISVIDDSAERAKFNFLPPRTPSQRKRGWRRASSWLSGLAILLAFACIAAWIWRQEAQMASLATAVLKARAESRAVENLQKEAEAAAAREQFLPRQRAQASLPQVLNEISRVLPDGTWLFQVELAGREVRMRGYSGVSSALIGILDSSPLFANAQFRAPLTRGPRGELERFDLSVELRDGPP